MRTGIMGAPQAAMVDVRDMLCAQALAVVARAVERLRAGERVGVRYSAEDVKRDLLVWAAARGHRVDDAAQRILHIERVTDI